MSGNRVLMGLLVLLAACETTGQAPLRSCTGCYYDFADTAPPNTALVFSWPTHRLPVRFYADPRGAMPSLVPLAIASWRGQFLYGEWSGVEVPDSTMADVIVTWASTGGVPPDVPPDPGPPVDACAGETSDPVTVFRDSAGTQLHIVLTPRAGFTDAQVAACLERVVIHEFGHALGLLRESDSTTDIMYEAPVVSAPSVRDRNTAEILYHTPATVTPR
ncbi:MAG TPA: hypothetical protein VLV45_04450 [Gemmatimonadales bacterium]|nr:hypothetical protein [Gemmatimonadales bacterium]